MTKKNTFNGIEYLTSIIEGAIDIYANKFKKTERPKILSILEYYNLELGSDVEYKLEINKWETENLSSDGTFPLHLILFMRIGVLIRIQPSAQ